MLTLETERLILRPFRMDDAEAMFACWASDPEVTKYLTWNAHESIGQTRGILNLWIEQYQKPERLNFAIELKQTGELIGGIDVAGYLGGPDGTPVIGYCIGKKYWNRGYMTEACKKVLELLFSRGYGRVRIDAAEANIGSRRVIEKCGGVFLWTEEETYPAKGLTLPVCRYIVFADNRIKA